MEIFEVRYLFLNCRVQFEINRGGNVKEMKGWKEELVYILGIGSFILVSELHG